MAQVQTSYATAQTITATDATLAKNAKMAMLSRPILFGFRSRFRHSRMLGGNPNDTL